MSLSRNISNTWTCCSAVNSNTLCIILDGFGSLKKDKNMFASVQQKVQVRMSWVKVQIFKNPELSKF